jgi:cobalt/nickel transport system ATP-binding protein
MIEIKNLSVVYPDGTKAVDDISFTVGDGESIALVGANGAGKTSLLLSLVGVLPIHSGSIIVDGMELNKKNLSEVRRKIGMVFQNPDDQLFMPMIYDDIAFGPRNFGLGEDEVRKRAEDALMTLGISHLRDRSSLKLSGGEKRIAAIATILVMDPSAVIFDEPTAFLDPKARRKLIGVLAGLPHGKLVATHDLTFAQEVCTRTIVIKKGRIFADGDPKTILHDVRLMDEGGLEATSAELHYHRHEDGGHGHYHMHDY